MVENPSCDEKTAQCAVLGALFARLFETQPTYFELRDTDGSARLP